MTDSLQTESQELAWQSVRLGFGQAGMTIRVPADATVLTPTAHPAALPDPAGAIDAALQNPIGAAPLRALIRARQPRRVAITISDITRPAPNRLVLPRLIAALHDEGVRDDQIVIVIATGMHRPSTAEERDILVGPALLSRIEVIDHKADDASGLVRVSDGPAVSVNRRFVEADFRIVTGLIEPHFMAGYSGGRKGICPALVDLETVQRFHGHTILVDPLSRTGVITGNPCHAEALRVANIVGCDFLVNAAITPERDVAGIYAGDMVAAHEAGVVDVARWTSAPVAEPWDLVITSAGGFPLDKTFYQTVKGMVEALPALHAASTLMIASEISEGVGSPEYAAMMSRWADDWQGFIDHIEAVDEVIKDQWQIQMHARVLDRISVDRLYLASDGLGREVFDRCMVTSLAGAGDAQARLQAAVDQYLVRRPDARVAVIPDGPYTQLALAPVAKHV